MKRKLIFSLFCLIHYFVSAQTPSNDLNWQLKWEDNFHALNTNIWEVYDHFDHWGNPYSISLSRNVYLNNDTLVLRAKSECYCCPLDPNYINEYWCKHQWLTSDCYQYTDGNVKSKPAYDTKFGYFEAKIKMTYRKGVYYAFWTFRGGHSQYVNASEIDIFETCGIAPNTLTTNVHTCYPDDDPNCIKPYLLQINTFPNLDYTTWHIYAVEWDANRIIWYLDGKPFRTLENKNLDNYGNSVIDSSQIKLGNAIPYPDKLVPPYNTAPFEEYMYVDYVKVYQLKCDKNTVVTQIPNFNTYNYKVNKLISLNSTTVIPPNSNITLRATDYIELTNGFEVPLGSELYLDVSPCEMALSIRQKE